MADLSVGERQQLEITRLLWLGARALMLDEPTTAISAQQRDKLFAALRKLAEGGKSVIFVSHKLEEVEALCDEVTVLNRGRVTGHAHKPYATDKLVQMMFGQDVPAAQAPGAARHDSRAASAAGTRRRSAIGGWRSRTSPWT